MKKFTSTIAALTMGIVGFGAISICADELQEKHVMVQIHKLSDSNTKVDLNVNGNAQVFDLPDLEVGETKDIISESGNSISITKTESGMTVSIDGEEINLPDVGNDMSAHIMNGGMPLHTASDGIQVIGDLTPEQVAIIDNAFKSAGVEKKIHFTQGHEMKFFLSADSDNADLEFVQELLSKDGENVKIIKMGKMGNGNIIKMGNGNGQIHMEGKVIIIKTEEENN